MAGERAAGSQLGPQEGEAFLTRQFAVRLFGAEPVHELPYGIVVVIGVFTDVQGCQVQTKGSDCPADAGQGAVCHQSSGMVPQRGFKQSKLRQQLRSGCVVAARLVISRS
ncbi:hypothetical protein D3C73_1393790 [compost metagenome]